MPETSNAPYATSPLKHDRKGGLLRMAVVALLIAGIGTGWWVLNRPASTSHEQAVADANVSTPGNAAQQ